MDHIFLEQATWFNYFIWSSEVVYIFFYIQFLWYKTRVAPTNMPTTSPAPGICPPVRLSVCPSVCLSICPLVRLSVRPSFRLSFCPSVRVAGCPSVPSVCLTSDLLSVCPSFHIASGCPFICESIHLSAYPSITMTVGPSDHRSVCLSVRLSIWLSGHLYVCPSAS
jgi:hypothetical protein